MRLQYMKETTTNSQIEKEYYDNLISNLDDYSIKLDIDGISYELKFKFDMKFTMVDGKVVSAVLGVKSAQTCNVCRANPTEMNDIDKVSTRAIIEESLLFGISPLHAWIRSFECILHIAYRLPVCKWRITKKNGDDHLKFCTQKAKIQKEFKKKMGLLVDFPKTGGSGTTNDGNTSRRAFHSPKLFSKITGRFEI